MTDKVESSWGQPKVFHGAILGGSACKDILVSFPEGAMAVASIASELLEWARHEGGFETVPFSKCLHLAPYSSGGTMSCW